MVEADPFGDIAHPEDIGAEMRETRQKSCRGMPVMLRFKYYNIYIYIYIII